MDLSRSVEFPEDVGHMLVWRLDRAHKRAGTNPILCECARSCENCEPPANSLGVRLRTNPPNFKL